MPLELNGTTGVQGNSGAFVSGTAVASTSGTSIDFTSIPSWVKRITVMFNGVSTNGSSNLQVQVGSGSVTATGYVGGYSRGATAASVTTGMVVMGTPAAASLYQGIITWNNVSGNIWVGSSNVLTNASDAATLGGSSISLSGTLDRVRITTVNGTDAFDAGSINILYE